MGDDVTHKDLAGIYEEIKEERKLRTDLDKQVALMAQAQASCFKALQKLSESVAKALHLSPCLPLIELRRLFFAHKKEHDDTQKTVELDRKDARGEWRKFVFNTAARILTWLFIVFVGGILFKLGWSIPK